ncbi:hypothetical protein MLD38_021284 [Melastoma candidum]|nr:hypothetical protein MLD38_021284 [Melastoma candidum]
MEPELEGLRSRLEEMRSRVEHERKVRKKAEKTSERLSRELVDERGAREALERMCERLAKEVRDEREAGERLRGEIEEERRMLRVAEVLREERVQMKLAEARALLEDRIGKLEGKVSGMQGDGPATIAVAGADPKKCLGERDRDPRDKTGNGGEMELLGGDHQGPVKGTGRRPSTEVENPHIMRGIKGFVEFPRGLRGVGSRSGNGRSWGPAKVEYHRAQIRILLKQGGSPVKSD